MPTAIFHEIPTRERFVAIAHECGFELAGIAPAEPREDVYAAFSAYKDWVDAGMAGPMDYLTDHRMEVRSDPRRIMPAARSVLCVGKLYNTNVGRTPSSAPDPLVRQAGIRQNGPTGASAAVRGDRPTPVQRGSAGQPHEAVISQYAWGARDYHDVVRADLERLVEKLHEAWGAFESRICVDTAPLLERTFAREAGLGWIGKNTCLINEPLGSWFFLGEILISIDLPPDVPPPDRCGTCSRCIDICPTQALVPNKSSAGPAWQLDGRLCISTLTIEQRGETPEATRAATGPHIFGCDLCQDVCPWNRRAPITETPEFQAVNAAPDLVELAEMTKDEFRARFRKTPLWRTKYEGLLRNVATAMGNSPDPRYDEPLQRLAQLDDAGVAEHARWAIERRKGQA
jgi:epoxyqueuosine reductase